MLPGRDAALTVLTDAWRSIVPPPGDRHGPLPPLLLVLTLVSGLVDAFSYLVLGHVFVANMTGNVLFLGFAIAGASGFSISASLLALGAFGFGALIGGRIIADASSDRARLLALAGSVETILILVALALSLGSGDVSKGADRHLLIGFLGLGLGIQNATVRRLAVPDLTTTVLTLTITGIAADSAAAGGRGSKLGRRGLAVVVMFAGGLAGAVCVVHDHRSISLLVAAISLAAVTVVVATLSRSRPAWASSPG